MAAEQPSAAGATSIARERAGPNGTLDQRVMALLDVLLVAGGVALLVLGDDAYAILLPAAVLPLVWYGVAGGVGRLDRALVVAFLLLAQHAVVLWIIAEIYDAPPGVGGKALDPEMGPVLIGVGALLVVRLLLVRDMWRAVRVAVPSVLIAAFLLLTIEKFVGLPALDLPRRCRVEAYAGITFVPPLFFGVFTIAALALWDRVGRAERWLLLGLVAASVIVGWGYSVSRGVGLAQIAGLGALVLAFAFVRGGADRFRAAGALLVAIAVGLGASWALDTVSGCNLWDRFLEIVRAFTITDPAEIDPNISLRVESLNAGLERIAEQPITGSGPTAEREVIAAATTTPLDHAHNQYISWTIWGGVPCLISGLLFLLAPAAAAWGVRDRFARTTLVIATAIPLPVSLLADSFMRLEHFLVMQFLLTAYVAGLAMEDRERIIPEASVSS